MSRALLSVALTALLLAVPAGKDLDPGMAKIRVTSQSRGVEVFGNASFTRQTIYTTDREPKAIGWSLMRCEPSPDIKDPRICDGTYSLPHGRIDVHGILSGSAVYTIAITGGTGTYRNAGGQLDAVRIAPRTWRLVFSLVAF
jgi:hypothetical protein